jgi:hypothetical protein
MVAKTFTGARAIVKVDNEVVGMFDSVNYTVNVSAEPIFTLGRFSAAEIVPTAYEAVQANCSGFRIINQGVHVLPKMPKLQDLLNLEGVTLAIEDRQGKAEGSIFEMTNCVPVSYSGGVNGKATSRIQITYLGIKATDESGDQNESAGATNLP